MSDSNLVGQFLNTIKPYIRSAGRSLACSTSHAMQRILDLFHRDDFIALFAVYFATVLGGSIRWGYALADVDFPLGDGGLFYQMTQEIAAADYTMPEYTAYNSSRIPFAYPPLSFFLAAFLSDIMGWPLLRIFSLMPAVVSILTIPTAHGLMRRILGSETEAAIGVVAFALLPRSMSWIIIGGGVARALGVLFSVLALSEAHSLYTTHQRGRVLSTAILASLAVLSHTEWGWFTFFSLALMFLFYGLRWESVVNSALTAVLVLLFTVPWWGTVLANHGLEPFLSAFGTGETLEFPFKEFFFIAYNLSHEPMLGVLAVTGLLGFFVCLAQRRWFLPAWLVTVFVLHSRNAGTESILALSMLVATSVHGLIVPGLLRLGEASYSKQEPPKTVAEIPIRQYVIWLPVLLFAISALCYAFYGGLVAARHGGLPLARVGRQEREAMEWIAVNTPEDSRFLVITSAQTWHLDFVSEWFPALTGRTSLGTVQGTEWLPDSAFQEAANRYFDLQDCAEIATPYCLDVWARQAGVDFTHVYVSFTARGMALVPTLNASSQYKLIYRNAGVQIFEQLPSEDTTDSP